uniref:Si:ch211-168b3.2 n=1 Tax=Cyprinus carpio TaxID=7962 RepID=A0A8C1TIY3_CYPCA
LKKTNQLIINLLKSLLPSSDSPGIAEVHSAWPIVLGALTAVLSIGLLIALSVRYHFFRWCLTRNSHALLLEGETAKSSDDDDDDDDGFIEDNYIQHLDRILGYRGTYNGNEWDQSINIKVLIKKN